MSKGGSVCVSDLGEWSVVVFASLVCSAGAAIMCVFGGCWVLCGSAEPSVLGFFLFCVVLG